MSLEALCFGVGRDGSKRADRGCYSVTLLILLGVLAMVSSQSAFAQINPVSSTTGWAPLLYGSGNFPDPSGDQQTGSTEGDIVGDTSHPSLYMRYNDGGFGSSTDGWIGFRFRVGGDPNPAGFKAVALVGLDADLDGRLDLFMGVNNSGSANEIGIWDPGTGLNLSPSTTTVATPAENTYVQTGANYGWTPVSALSDPPALSYDLNADGSTDRFLTFVIRFSDVTAAMMNRGISFDVNSIMRLVAFTSNQINSLNQDLNGVMGGVNSNLTWDQLGGMSQPYTPTSIIPVPEPSTLTIACLAGGLLLLFPRRQAGRKD